MYKKYFVLKEDIGCDNYPTLVRLKDYKNRRGQDKPTSAELAKKLVDEGYAKIETPTNIILHKLGV